MTVPSYEDLTAGIPDVVDSEQVDRLALFLGAAPLPSSNPQLPTPTARESTELEVGRLYACLRNLEKSPDHQIPQSPDSTIPQSPDSLLAVARDFSPRVMAASEREVLLDVSGLGQLIGEPPAIARELTRALCDAGLNAQVALAPTQTAARLLATQSAGGDITRLPNLSVSLLQPLETLPPAMSDRERARPYDILERWGIQTLGDFAALPGAELSSRLGRRGAALQRLARGLDPGPFVPDPGTPRFVASVDLEWPIDALEPLSFIFARLLEPLSASLERADRGAIAIRLDLRLTDRSTHARILPLPAPLRDARVLRTLLLLNLESGPLFSAESEGPSAQRGGGGALSSTVMIDAVTIELDPAPARITQFSLLQRALPSPETVSTLMARLSALTGVSRVGSAALLDTHQPDAFEMVGYAPDRRAEGADGAKGAKGAGANGADGANGAGAEGAEGAKGAVLRRQRTPPAIRVAVEHGRPLHMAASKRGLPHGAVIDAAGPWRASGGWWTTSATAGWGPSHGAGCSQKAWNRDEWDVALASGAVCRIFQDRNSERWFLEAIYD